MAGFALDEYVVPKSGASIGVTGGTMAKASMEQGGMFMEIKNAAKRPGPDAYNKEFLSKPFSNTAKGGTFSKLTREYGKIASKTPSVGQYEVANPQVTPRTRGGVVSKTDRGCVLYDLAAKESKWKQAPGKYNSEFPTAHFQSPSFHTTKTESRIGKKAGGSLGPGHYQLNHNPIEEKVVSYTSPREPARSTLEKTLKEKEKIPAPGHNGIPESKVEDRAGRRMHSTRLLADRIVTPRFRPATSATAGTSNSH